MHVQAEGRVARDAARCAPKLVRRIIKGIIDQLKHDGIMKEGEVGMYAVDDDADVLKGMRSPEQGHSGKYRDASSGQTLKDALVVEARAKELGHFTEKGVWLKRPRQDAFAATGRAPVSVKWVDVNKGDDVSPKYRGRLVARQLKAMDTSGQSFFAPTPPLEALRTIMSLAASDVGDWKTCRDPASNRRTQILMLGISRAYFNAKTDEDQHTYVQLPPEDEDSGVSER